DNQGRWLMRDDDIRKLRGFLRLEVADPDGRVMYHGEGPLGSFIWGNWRGGRAASRSSVPGGCRAVRAPSPRGIHLAREIPGGPWVSNLEGLLLPGVQSSIRMFWSAAAEAGNGLPCH